MDLGLSGRTAIVCGASAGLGLACAESLAEDGANVLMFARREEELRREASRLGALAVPGDVRIEADLERVVDAAISAFGGIDVVVWNGGGPPPGPAAAVTDETDVPHHELVPCRRPTHPLCLPHLESSGRGRQSRSLGDGQGPTHYWRSERVAAGSSAEDALTRGRPEGDHRQLRRAGPDRHRTARRALPVRPERWDLAQIPVGRWGPRELGDVVLPRSERAAYVTGTTIAVDGGLTRGLV
jgi:3-oxoacyl-[acyl-carrier protein] reductase